MVDLKPGNWVTRVPVHCDASTNSAWTNMPAAATFLFGLANHITLIDFTGMARIRFLVNKRGVAGPAGSKLILRYDDAYTVNPANYVDIGVSEVSVAINVANDFLDSGWVELNPDVLGIGEVYMAVVGEGGDGVLDPQFGSITVDIQ